MARNFTHRLATRDKTPLLVSLVGPSSSGKTYSALRLATGFQRVNPGDIFMIDTEAGRALQYADDFRFVHVPFGAPFGPLDYLDVIKYAIDHGATNIVIDSMSHEHEGPGGMLEMHEQETRRMARDDASKFERVKGFAWGKPKSEHRQLINAILQLNCNFVFCFRAKEKLDWDTKPPRNLGYMAIGGGDWKFDMTAQCLLMPMARGVPTWKSEMLGERDTIKLPKQFEEALGSSPQLTEDVGEAMARWASGASPPKKKPAKQLIDEYKACSESSEFRRLEESRRVSWASLSSSDKTAVKTASEQCSKKIEDAAKAPPLTFDHGDADQIEDGEEA